MLASLSGALRQWSEKEPATVGSPEAGFSPPAVLERATVRFGPDRGRWARLLEGCHENGREEDLELLTHALAIDGVDVPESVERTIAIQRSEGRLTDAYRLYRCLPAASKNSSKVIRELAAVHFEAGERARALRWALHALRLDPTDEGALGIAIVTWCESGDYEAAVRAIEEADPLAMRCSWALEVLFRAFSDHGDGLGRREEEARRWAQRALHIVERRTPEEPLIIARAYRLLKDYDRAATTLEQVRGSIGDQPEIASERVELALESWRWHDHIADIDQGLRSGHLPRRLRRKAREVLDWHRSMTRFYEGAHSVDCDFAVPHSTFEMLFHTEGADKYEAGPLGVALVGGTLAAGGAEKALCNAHIALNENGDTSSELWIYSLDPGEGHDFFYRQFADRLLGPERTVEVGRDSAPRAPFSWLPADTGQHAAAVAELLGKRRPKVVHAWQDSTNLEVAAAAVTVGVPKIVVHPHNMRPDLVHQTRISVCFQRAYRALLARPEVHLVCVSEASLSEYRGWLGLERNDRQHVIHNGFEWPAALSPEEQADRRVAARSELGIDQNAFVIGGMFRLVALKRPELWLEIAVRMVDASPDVQFVLFGDGPGLAAMQEQVSERGLDQRIVLCGRVSRAAEKASAFDVLLHTSSNEGLPTVALEAQAVGVPVVAADVGGVRETLCPDSSVLVAEDDSEAFIAVLERMRKRPPNELERAHLGAFVRKGFTLERLARQLREIYLSA